MSTPQQREEQQRVDLPYVFGGHAPPPPKLVEVEGKLEGKRTDKNDELAQCHSTFLRHVLALTRNVHPCSAGRQTIAFLKEEGVQDVLLHNFAGRQSVTLEGVQAGYYFSFPPAVTRHDQVIKLIKQIPLENICLKTDPPSLAPNKEVFSNLCDSMILYICKSHRDLTRWRNNLCAAKDNCLKESLENAWSAFPTQELQQGQSLLVSVKERNEPEKIRIVSQPIAVVKGISLERVCEVTKNAPKLLPKVNQPLSE
ncbi:LOW QUALITY PROTEIN: putative deoxyribonuclease TATDN3 [Spheniscus humboldti]